jgi:type I restriction enzyme S subunit
VSDKLKPYPKYKDSGVPWLGQIPEHWDVRRNGRLFAQRNETGFGELPILEVSLRTGVRVRDMDNLKRKQVMSDAEKYKRAAKGDIAYNMMRMWQGALGTAPVDGLVSPAYVVARPFEETNPNYYSYLFRTEAYKAEVDGYSRGIVKDRNRLYWQDFKCMPSCFPPPEEQAAIVRFLNANAVLVRQFIRNRKRLIDALIEQKQAIINRVVSQGLNPNVEMKTSGVDWLGDVPQHWKVMPIKRFAQINPARTESIEMRNSTVQVSFLPMEKVSTSGQVDYSLTKPINEVWQGFTYFQRDDVVVAKITPCFENGKGACLSGMPTNIGFGTTEFMVLRPSNTVSPQYLYALTSTSEFRRLGKESMTGAAGQQRVSADFVANFPVAVPPLSEQTQILNYIAKELIEFDKAIDLARLEIQHMTEYRDRLIEDIVHGRIDVSSNTLSLDEVALDLLSDNDSEEVELDEELNYADD